MEVLPSFYQGVLATTEEALQALEIASIVNLVGNVVVMAAVKRGLVDPEAIIRINGVPHAQIVRV